MHIRIHTPVHLGEFHKQQGDEGVVQVALKHGLHRHVLRGGGTSPRMLPALPTLHEVCTPDLRMIRHFHLLAYAKPTE